MDNCYYYICNPFILCIYFDMRVNYYHVYGVLIESCMNSNHVDGPRVGAIDGEHGVCPERIHGVRPVRWLRKYLGTCVVVLGTINEL